MKGSDIRSRILVAAMLPVALVVLLLVTVFLVTRLGDSEEAHSQRVRSLARQLAASCEYGLFAGNRDQLQSIALAALREPDLRSVTIMSAEHEVLARAGIPGYVVPATLGSMETEQRDLKKGIDLLVQPISASQIELNDLFQNRANGVPTPTPTQILGHVLLEASSERMLLRRTELLWLGLILTLGGLVVGGVLAMQLGQRVIGPVARVSDMVRRIGQGELAVRAEILPDDPLRDLQQGLNQMAQRLELSRDELEQRIKEATTELREKKEIAETATRAKSRFLAAASHDLRQPTHALGMFVARLGQLQHDAETQQLIGNLERSVQSMRDLLDSLLDVSRLDAGVVPVQIRPFALSEVFERLQTESMMTASAKGLRLRVRPTSVWVRSDPALLHRILLNLLSNAMRYTANGTVLLACRRSADGQRARIEVWDSGIGIATEHQQDIFKEFYQVGNIERDRGKGLGLGLNIVQRTAQLLGCTVHVQSRPAVGSRFSIQVPVTMPEIDGRRRDLPVTDAVDDLDGLAVLLVEDDALAREALADLLASWGARVAAADDLSTALQRLVAAGLPDVIISDYRLRDDCTGLAVVQQLRLSAGRQIPACLISGDTDPELLLRVREAGLTLLHKPVRPAKLRSLIRRLASRGQPLDGSMP